MISFISDSIEESPPPQVYRDGYGRVISKSLWEKQQAAKRKAKEGGYVVEDFSQI